MRVVTDSNETIDLGITETAPTITITDYSRRVTDAFGVTTVVPRKFSRRLSARFALATTSVDTVQRRLAGLRASTALWVADDLVKWLSVRGFLQEFEFGVSDPRTSFCTLSIEGLAENETVADAGGDPAPDSAASSLRLLQPVAVTSSTLVSSTVAENDYAAWASGTTYAKGARVILASTHRITDYSRKEVDDFGDATVVQRAWAKRMAARALIRTDAVDQVANRIAAVRARPCLWIADQQLDSVTIYGFFKDFSIEVGERVSKLSLSIEGLSKAAPIATAAPDAGGLTPRGNYDPAVTYNEGDVVQYDGSSWYFIQETPSSGHAPPLLPATENAYWRVFAQAGRNGEDAPLVLVQWSVDGMTNWHANYADGDLYQRQSNDNGVTWGPAVRVVGEAAGAGADGISPSIIFRRLATVPATPQQDTGNPPPGWSDAPPAGTDLLWQSVSKFRGGTQLEPWSAPVRITGPVGASAFNLTGNTVQTIVTPTGVAAQPPYGDWGLAHASSLESFTRGAVCNWTAVGVHSDKWVVGLSHHPKQAPDGSPSTSFNSVAFGIFRDENGFFGTYQDGEKRLTAGNSAAALRCRVHYDGLRTFRLFVNESQIDTIDWPYPDVPLFFAAALAGNDPRIENVSFTAAGAAGQPGASAPLVRVQWSIDGVTNWHDNYMGADVYQRQSNDGGVTWGPAYKVIGESGDGPSIVFKRSATIPATPANNSGNPPSGWTDGPPAGTDFLWQSKATFKGSTQLTSWSAPVRISGEDGMVVDTETTNFVQPVFSTGANKPAWTGGSGTIRLNKGGQRVTSGVTYAVVNNSGVANLSVNGDTFSFSGSIDDVGAFTIRATYAGLDYDKVVTVKKVYDGEAAFKGAIPLTNGSGTSAFSVPAGRQTIVSGQATYQIGGSQVGTFVGTMALYWRNKTDNGPTNFLGQVEGTAATSVNTGTSGEPVYDRKPGTVSAAFSFVAPSPSKEIEFSVVVTRSQGNATATISGSAGMEVRS